MTKPGDIEQLTLMAWPSNARAHDEHSTSEQLTPELSPNVSNASSI
jgi:hypothetical protein